MYSHILLCFFKNLVLQTDSRNCWFHISFSHIQYLNCLGIANPILWITDSEVERGRLGVCTNIHLLKGDATSSPCYWGGGSLQATLLFLGTKWRLEPENNQVPNKKTSKNFEQGQKNIRFQPFVFLGGPRRLHPFLPAGRPNGHLVPVIHQSICHGVDPWLQRIIWHVIRNDAQLP